MSWELFEYVDGRKVNEYIVRISLQKKIYLNRPIVSKFNLTLNRASQVWYDSDTNKVKIFFALHFDRCPRQVCGINSKNVYINIAGFFKYFKLQAPTKDIKIKAQIEHGALVFNLG